MKRVSRILYSGVALSLLSVSPALATGFSTEGVDPAAALFSYKSFELRAALAHVWAGRDYENGSGTVQGPPLLGLPRAISGSSDTDAADDYNLASGDLKIGIGDNLDCAGRWHEPYKLTNEVSDDFVGRYELSKFHISSEGIDGTCSVKFPVTETGLLRLIAGIRSVELDAERNNFVPAEALLAAGTIPSLAVLAGEPTTSYQLSSDERDYGHRLGAAFEIPAMALRAQIIYDSEIDVSMSGTQTLTVPLIPLAGGTTTTTAPVSTSFTLPQAISARFQTGINPTTLVWMGARWQEWSVIQGLTVEGGIAGDRTFDTNWNDGWTLEAGVGKKLTENLSVRGSVTWNEGIGDGYTDTWTFAGGAAIRLDEYVTLNLGGSATLLTDSTEEDDTSYGGGALMSEASYEQGEDWAFAIGAQIVIAVD